MATIALHNLTRGELLDYAYAVGPFLAGIALLPTLSCAAGREPPPPWPTLPLSHAQLSKHFLFSQGSPVYTCATSLLAHLDSSHQANNLIGVALAGWRPARALGPLGFAAVFVGGHLAAVLNSAGRRDQMRLWMDSQTRGMATWVTPRAARIWERGGMWTSCGASAGLFALLGVDLCMTFEQASHLLSGWDAQPEEARPQLAAALRWLGLAAAQTLGHVLREHRSQASGASASVSHVGHLTGFAWGVGCWALLAASSTRRPRGRRTNWGGGRRLGGR